MITGSGVESIGRRGWSLSTSTIVSYSEVGPPEEGISGFSVVLFLFVAFVIGVDHLENSSVLQQSSRFLVSFAENLAFAFRNAVDQTRIACLDFWKRL